MTTFSLNDDSVIVIIGSGAGGGTLANELCRRGLPVVLLEAGKRESPATFINDEWPSFEQLAWSDPRTTSGSWQVAGGTGLPRPARVDLQDRWRHHHPLGRRQPAVPGP
ncbi:hypothetical protein QS468_15420 [Bacillus subtilis]|nr:hypothetical protein [Pseudomonas sp. A29(2023)]MDL5594105.1 hypothetical protein [Bacillus subtilis]